MLVPDHELRQDSPTRIATGLSAVQVNIPEPAAMHRRAVRRTVDVFPDAKRQASKFSSTTIGSMAEHARNAAR
jgi:hypothetical protein